MNIENEFADFIMQTNKDGSNKARSYLLALKSVNTLLRGGFLPEFDIGNIYDVTDIATLNRLGKHIHKEGRDPQTSLIDPDAGEKAKLQPDNALCLSATYAEAFKAHLITFDEKLRLVLSKSLREHTTTSIFDSVFKQYENSRIRTARHFPPAEKFLARHRELLAG